MHTMIKMAARRETFRRRLRDQGPLSLKTHPSKEREGEIMSIAKSPVVTMAPTTPIYEAVRMMSKEGFRRIPVVDPGTKRLLGLVTATDIVNFFGGGEKHQLVQRKYGGSFYKAINEPIRSIMTQDVVSINTTGKISEALILMKRHKIGGLPVVDDDKRVLAILTERDLISLFKGRISGVKVSELMTKRVETATPGTSIFEAERTMIEQGFRRLPIVSDKTVLGMITTRSILRFFGSGQVFKHLQSGNMAQVLQTSVLEASIKEVDQRTVSPNVDVGEAARIMQDRDFGSLLVIENERLVGIITERDFFKLIA
jgi:CBS domain-containing protein